MSIPRNTVAHFAINADDVEQARAFYGKVFGWTFTAWGPSDFYQIQAPGSPIRGALQRRRELVKGERTQGFECTIAVESIDATEQAVAAAGGEVVMPRAVIPGVGTLMFFRDLDGNVFGAMQYEPQIG